MCWGEKGQLCLGFFLLPKSERGCLHDEQKMKKPSVARGGKEWD